MLRAAILILLFSLVLGGCSNPFARYDNPTLHEPNIPQSAKENLYQSLQKTHSLVIVGLLIATGGLIALLNGRSGAQGWLAGGLALTGMTLAVLRFGYLMAAIAGIIVVLWLLLTLFHDGGFLSIKSLRNLKPKKETQPC